jgi:pyridoxamine 5'-phosphate oxidase
MWFADETGFYFHTGTMKAVYEQLENNPQVELCFYNPEAPPSGKMMRVSGEVKIINDDVLKERLFGERPFLKAIEANSSANHSVVIFRV